MGEDLDRLRLRIDDEAAVAMQVRAARSLLSWSQADLAARAGVATRSVADLETQTTRPRRETLTKLKSVLIDAGIRFIRSDGVLGVTITEIAAGRTDCSKSV
ncbi:helix-turn-helix domain-containing protein [Methylobacterium brachythecii]|nr:helix-turn-helix domain-containing protein [Methylobacterium brachythecii]MBB3903956.1 transcriptional regulator with XRE-family HTH domain [Methylobacterium brachythecii]